MRCASHLPIGMPDTSDNAASVASMFWLGAQTSALSVDSLTVAFMGSMHACARKGVL